MSEKNWVEEAVKDTPAPEAEVEKEQPAVESQPEPEAEQPDEPQGKTRTVPHEALHRERKLRQEAEQRERERAIEFARAEERLKIIEQAWEQQNQPTQPAAETPNPDTDPMGYLQHQLESERRAREALEKKFSEQQGVTEQQRQQAQITQAYSTVARDFQSRTPDFTDAYQHLWKELDQDLADQGVSDPEARRRALMQDEMKFAHTLLAQNKNPAEVIYQWAKRRGYQGKAAEAPADLQPEQQVELQAKRNQASRSLSESGGRPPSNVTLKDIASMDADEFRKATNGKNWEKLLRQAAR